MIQVVPLQLESGIDDLERDFPQLVFAQETLLRFHQVGKTE